MRRRFGTALGLFLSSRLHVTEDEFGTVGVKRYRLVLPGEG